MTLTVGVMPKSTRNPYFEDCRRGAEEAARDAGFTLLWDGPRDPDAPSQARMIERWVEQGVSAIAVSVEDPARVSPALAAARARGVKVATWDADGTPEARDFTVVPATPESVSHALCWEVARITGGSGECAAITSTLSAPNQNAWIAQFRSRLAREQPELRLVVVRPCQDRADVAAAEATALLLDSPGLKAVVGFCAPAVPGAADAVKQAGRADVRVTGVSLPSVCRSYLEEGSVDSVVFWKTRDLGYLAAACAHALALRELERGAVLLRAGRLGNVMVRGDEVRLGRCHIVTKGNVGSFVG
jgi:rhamnose transport system permease protein